VKEKVATLLGEASKLLSECSGGEGSRHRTEPSSSSSSLQETLRRANSMLRQSSSSGLCKRLSRSERLRAASGSTYQRSKQANEKPKKEKKAMEFALLRCFEDDDIDEPHNLKWDSVLTSGMLMLQEEEDEKQIRSNVLESLKAKFPVLGANDFDFGKVRHKAISTLQLGPGTEYNFPVVKKMAGQGMLYLKVKQGFEFVFNGDTEDEEEMEKSVFETTDKKEDQQVKQGVEFVYINGDDEELAKSVFEFETTDNKEEQIPETDTDTTPAHQLKSCINNLITAISQQGLTDPVEILRFLPPKGNSKG